MSSGLDSADGWEGLSVRGFAPTLSVQRRPVMRDPEGSFLLLLSILIYY
jgi:hypothetical protein